ncbi:cell fusion related protein [Heterostelium album PN500]|uniref:Cell fusion related protein n=1 Tax=Heterostelium pallidum (strain ATCC 26659 / Pp 5 / PN500) TaxID=670386 RepID=D3BII0_HETP5|nr:cell fusion related protein [Heterostelium album PN500]EFA78604.1 cell fusion related protein [Heterostelium album PN500]|eukprot:XP_020430728.1 cell fusion related protein [Heterostelium album PN500]
MERLKLFFIFLITISLGRSATINNVTSSQYPIDKQHNERIFQWLELSLRIGQQVRVPFIVKDNISNIVCQSFSEIYDNPSISKLKKAYYNYHSLKWTVLKTMIFNGQFQESPDISNQYKEFINSFGYVLSSLSELKVLPSQSTIYSLTNAINSIDNSILSATNKQSIIQKSTTSINTVLSTFNDLSTVYLDCKSNTNIQSIQNGIVKLQTLLNNINSNLDQQISLIDSYYKSCSSFPDTLFITNQILLETYNLVISSSLLENILANELILISNYQINNFDVTLNQEKNNQINTFISKATTISQQLVDLIRVFNGINVASLTDVSVSSIAQSSFTCHYQHASRSLNSWSKYALSGNNYAPLDLGDISYCRDMYNRKSKKFQELVISGNLSASKFNNLNTELIYNYGSTTNNLLVTNSLTNISQLQQQQSNRWSSDWVLFLKGDAPDTYQSYYSQNSTVGPLLKSSLRSLFSADPICDRTNCPFPKCCFKYLDQPTTCIDTPLSCFIVETVAECMQCINGPSRCYYQNTDPRNKICPFVCLDGGYEKTLGPNVYVGADCVPCAIGSYNPARSNETCKSCTMPASLTPTDYFGALNRSSSNNCLFGVKYSGIFVTKSDPSQLALISARSLLNTQRTVEFKFSLLSLPTSNVSTIYSIAGVDKLIMFGLQYSNLQPGLFKPVIYNTTTSSILYQSMVSVPLALNVTYHMAYVISDTMVLFYLNRQKIFQTPYAPSFQGDIIGVANGLHFIGGPLFQRLNMTLDEYRVFLTQLTPLSLGYGRTDSMVKASCDPVNEQLCNSQCVSCNSNAGFVLDNSTCTCSCPVGSEIVNGRCTSVCPAGSIRNSDITTCQCVSGEHLTWQSNYITLSSSFLYKTPLNSYPDNQLDVIGIRSVKFFNSKGDQIMPLSCLASSFDVYDCNALYDSLDNTYWTTSKSAGFGWVTFTMPTATTTTTANLIERIDISPLNNNQTMKSITISFSQVNPTPLSTSLPTNVIPLISNLILPLNSTIQIISLNQHDPTFAGDYIVCSTCPSVPIANDNDNSKQPTYRLPPKSTIPQSSLNSCGCIGNFKFYPPLNGCMPPLPTPTASYPPGAYPIGTIVTFNSNVYANQSDGLVIRFTTDGSDPTDQSPDITSLDLTTLGNFNIRVASFQKDRLTSAILSGMYSFLGIINCTISPTPTTNFSLSVTIKLKCTATPMPPNSPSSWIFYSTDGSSVTTFSQIYNELIGIILVANPIYGINNITLNILSQISGYSDYRATFNYIVIPTLPPPVISPSTTNANNQVKIGIRSPFTGPSNYSMQYDIVQQGIVIGDSSPSVYYSKEFTVQCLSSTGSCLVHIRARGNINDLYSTIIHQNYLISFNMINLSPVISSKYDKQNDSMTVTIDKNTDIEDVVTMYIIDYYPTRNGPIDCNSSRFIMDQGLPYTSDIQLNLKGYYYVYSRNMLGLSQSSIQVCKLVVYTAQIESPFILSDDTVFVDGKLLRVVIAENNSTYPHQGRFYYKLNGGIVSSQDDATLLAYPNVLTIPIDDRVIQTMEISVIDCPDNYQCSVAATKSIKVVPRVPKPLLTPAGNTNYYGDTPVTATCPLGTPRYLQDSGSSVPTAQSDIFPSPLTLFATFETQIYQLSVVCFHDILAPSQPTAASYTIEKYKRPITPIIIPNNGVIIIPKGHTIQIQSETGQNDIYFNVVDTYSRLPVILSNYPDPSTVDPNSTYPYHYSEPIKFKNFGPVTVSAIIKSPTQQSYDKTDSSPAYSENKIKDYAPEVKNNPDEKRFYPTAKIVLYTEVINSQQVIHYALSKTELLENQTIEYKIYTEPFEIFQTTYIYAFVSIIVRYFE